MLEKIDLKNLDKSNWQTYKFEKIAQKISKTVKPDEANVDVYVGLEHLDAEDIHIRRKGVPSDVKGGKLRCYPGDIIFGKRRAYQRKAAIVDFEGICSAHAFVFRANPKVIDPKLFPFFLHSDQFMHRMVDISVGGLSPTINWGDLKNQEFLLPPKEQQAQLAELLRAMDEVIERQNKVLQENRNLKDSVSHNLLLGKNIITHKYQKSPYGDIPKGWKLVKLFELRDSKDRYSFTGGPFGSDLKSSHYTKEGVRVLQLQNIGEGEFLGDYSIYTSVEKANQLLSCNIYPGEIILAKMAPVARCCIIPDFDSRYVMSSDGIRLKVDTNQYDNKYVYHALNSIHFRRYAETKSTGSTRGRIGLSDLKALPIPIPCNISLQKEIAVKLDAIDKVSNNLESKISRSKALKKSLINQVF
ncbi:restriction endonuclease subunit S [Arenibacter palladensis]|uniref:restriction endonuclease subunit S n=1 Tax=Arenibacter palladensis TaxID=237373 RepID=UPI0026E37888|nr:restriction endonuclease subunit S [Arenibacter palladensis]MDO6604706.1 restriction endonuclease subunit S [Arenibacter palladensis]